MQATKDLVDLPGDHEGGQMQHHTDADSGADIGRAGGKVAPAGMKSVGDDGLNLVIDRGDLLPDCIEAIDFYQNVYHFDYDTGKSTTQNKRMESNG